VAVQLGPALDLLALHHRRDEPFACAPRALRDPDVAVDDRPDLFAAGAL
jgi:hypothetical protein